MTPTPLEEWAGVLVKREDLVDDVVPSGKLRGVLPHLAALKTAGVRTVVNAGATHSNSHVIVAYAASLVGLRAVCVVNTSRPKPSTDAAAAYGAEVRLAGPSHLGPLRARAAAYAARYHRAHLLAWGLAEAGVFSHYAAAVAEVPAAEGTIHIVPMGAGGVAAGIYDGLAAARRLGPERIVAVPVMPLPSGPEGEFRRLGRLPGAPRPGLEVQASLGVEATPWPSDPRYEWAAWQNALAMAGVFGRVVFYSVGRPVYP